MPKMDLRRVDLNLLKTFVALERTASVTAASEDLGVAPSSTSHALAKLRRTFGDQLYVRTRTGMQPTALARRLIGPILAALNSLESAFAAEIGFDPLTSRRSFRILMTDIAEFLILPPLLERLSAIGSEIEIDVRQIPRSRYSQALETGAADLALGQLPEMHTDFMQQTLCEVAFICAMRTQHPLADRLTIESFLGARHLAIGSPAVSDRLVKRALGGLAAKRDIALTVPHYLAAPFVLARGDLLGVLPEALCDDRSLSGIITKARLPFDLPPAVFRQFWHERTHADPGCRWLRSFIADGMSSAGGDAAKTFPFENRHCPNGEDALVDPG